MSGPGLLENVSCLKMVPLKDVDGRLPLRPALGSRDECGDPKGMIGDSRMALLLTRGCTSGARRSHLT